MQYRMPGLASAVVALGLVACSDGSDVSTAPRLVTSALTPVLTCDFKATATDARAYFPSGVQTTVSALIRTMQGQYGTGTTADENNTGFDIMRYIADAHRLGTAAGTADVGSSLTNDLIACMDVGITNSIPFAPALGATGGYEVRGGGADAVTPVGALGKQSALQAPELTTVSWNTWAQGRALFYGSRISDLGFLTENAVNTFGYNWSTVPVRHTLTGDGLVGVCISGTNRDRIQKSDELGKSILTVRDFTPLVSSGVLQCPTATASATPTGFLPRLAALVRTVFLPTPAYAAADGGGTGGTLNGLSDIGVIDAGQVNLTMSPISDATTTTPLGTITVTAKGNSGTGLPNVTITLLVSGNNGSYTRITTNAQTDAHGIVTFSGITLDKAGGYTLEATANFTGFADAGVFSNLFHIKQP
jgi:hypothetical protein